MIKFVSFLFFDSLLAVFLIIFIGCGDQIYASKIRNGDETDNPEKIIIKIYEEVKEIGLREGEEFIKREFHFDLDGKEQNREEHVLVFSYNSLGKQVLSLQITYYEYENNNKYQGRARDIKDITCLITKDSAEITECHYSQQQIKEILPKILKGIKKEKELLKLVHKEQ
jgi:hypothetical protein